MSNSPNLDFSDRELEILRLIAAGWTNSEIAEELTISKNTVRWYNKQIYAKLDVHSRTLAVARAREVGVLDSPSIMRDRAIPHQAQTAQMDQQVYFTSSIDGVRVAYATAGSGPPLVKTANYLSHLEFDWESPVWRHWLTELSRDHTLIRYDERGTGLSDWVVEDLSFASWVNDLEAVVDALGLERFPLLGLSQGGPVALAYAVRHPEKVSHLILFGSYARGWLHRNLTDDKREEERIMIDLMRVGWGRDNPAFSRVLSTQIMPEASSEQMRALDELARISATPENAVKLEMEMHRIDVQALAAQVRVPTLVIHPKGDGAVPFDEGRYLASLIPRARFVTLESRNHILLAQEPAWEKFVTTLRHFLAT